jgi:chemotaxis protein MotB
MPDDKPQKDQPIIIVKKVKKHAGHHGGAWKVAYADFVTAMMAFFLVMWLVTQSNTVKQAIQSYFLDPANHAKNFKSSVLEGGVGVVKGGAIGEGLGDEMTQQEQLKKEMAALGDRLKSAIKGMPGLDILRNSIEIEMTREGLRIQLIEGSKDITFFKSGRATLSRKAELIMKTIAMELSKIPNQLVIEGHTDASDNSFAEHYTNWELSADRANAARRAMVEGGLGPQQVYNVRGYAANKLRIKDDPYDPRNRRITILVLNRVPGIDAPEDDYQTPIMMSSSDGG